MFLTRQRHTDLVKKRKQGEEGGRESNGDTLTREAGDKEGVAAA